jgi:hypothetical protein
MDIKEIELAAKHITGDYYQQLNYIAGATMVNELQPYTAEDIKSLLKWISDKMIEDPWFRPSSHINNSWFVHTKGHLYFDEILELWEEQRNEQGIR